MGSQLMNVVHGLRREDDTEYEPTCSTVSEIRKQERNEEWHSCYFTQYSNIYGRNQFQNFRTKTIDGTSVNTILPESWYSEPVLYDQTHRLVGCRERTSLNSF